GTGSAPSITVSLHDALPICNWSPSNGQQFQQALQNHVNNPATQAIPGTYRHSQNVVHLYNPQTGLNVVVNSRGQFVTGWRLSPRSEEHTSELQSRENLVCRL